MPSAAALLSRPLVVLVAACKKLTTQREKKQRNRKPLHGPHCVGPNFYNNVIHLNKFRNSNLGRQHIVVIVIVVNLESTNETNNNSVIRVRRGRMADSAHCRIDMKPKKKNGTNLWIWRFVWRLGRDIGWL